MSDTIQVFQERMREMLDAIIEFNTNIDIDEIIMLRSFVAHIATEKHLRQMYDSMISEESKIKEHDIKFFINHQPFRTWLKKFIDDERLEILIQELWWNNTDEFRQIMWEWLEFLIRN